MNTGLKFSLFVFATIIFIMLHGSCKKNTPVNPPPTGQLPSLTTNVLSLIKSTTASCGGDISSDGGSSIIARGVCWSLGSTPTLLNNKTNDGAGFGSFVSAITSLAPNTSYYVRAYATNSTGTAYGNALFFTTYATAVGDNYLGGVIGYILQPTDPGYDASVQHGLIAAPTDQSTGILWYNGINMSTAASGTAIGTGNANTNKIVAAQGAGSYAASICFDLNLGGYSDWYLPSKDELLRLYTNRVAIGGFINSNYWTSSETGGIYSAWAVFWAAGTPIGTTKDNSFWVRAIRSF
ncbi:MAG: DUF1566 domain-containing protein [Bacteroidetes bacterium]|nr:DUF1566 domain-containing protein [Bacteroidota bacterium]